MGIDAHTPFLYMEKVGVRVRIYTRTGDRGETSLIYGKRVAKNDMRVEAYGTCDELNAIIGMAISHLEQVEQKEDIDKIIVEFYQIQTILFHVGAELATPSGKEVTWQLKESHVKQVEEQIDNWQATLPSLTNFILPSGHIAATTVHHARTVARRAERIIVGMKEDLDNVHVFQYMNRLSDYLFVAARTINHRLRIEERHLHIEA